MNPRAASEDRWSEERYLVMERESQERHEFLSGHIYAMAGASETHVLVAGNISAALHAAFRHRPCVAFQSDMRVRIESVGLYTYPDVIAVCGERKYSDTHNDTLLNPQVICEILSDSTESYDRGQKFEWYRTVPSITDVLLISQKKPLVEQYTRQPDGSWVLHERRSGDPVMLASLGCELAVDEIYLKVDFTQEAKSTE